MSALRLGRLPDGTRHVVILDAGSPVGENYDQHRHVGGEMVIGESNQTIVHRYQKTYRDKKRAARQQGIDSP